MFEEELETVCSLAEIGDLHGLVCAVREIEVVLEGRTCSLAEWLDSSGSCPLRETPLHRACFAGNLGCVRFLDMNANQHIWMYREAYSST